MKMILSVLAITALLACTTLTVSAADVLDLSTLNKKPIIEPVSLPKFSPNMPTSPATDLGGNVKNDVLDLSTLGKKTQSSANATMIKGASPIVVTPMFSVKNNETDNKAGSVYTLPQAISAGTIVYTPPIAIFGGA